MTEVFLLRHIKTGKLLFMNGSHYFDSINQVLRYTNTNKLIKSDYELITFNLIEYKRENLKRSLINRRKNVKVKRAIRISRRGHGIYI